MIIPVNVTQYCIRKGKCGDPEKCAIALGVANALRYGYVEVNSEGVIKLKGRKGTYTTLWSSKPNKTRRKFVNDFDNKKSSVKPLNFTLNIPKSILETLKSVKKES